MGQIYFLKGNLTNKIDMSNGHVWKTELLGGIQGFTRKLELTVSPLFHLKHPRAVVLTSPHEPPRTQRERGLDRGSDEAGQLMEGVNHSTPVQRNSCPLFHFPLLKVALQVTKDILHVLDGLLLILEPAPLQGGIHPSPHWRLSLRRLLIIEIDSSHLSEALAPPQISNLSSFPQVYPLNLFVLSVITSAIIHFTIMIVHTPVPLLVSRDIVVKKIGITTHMWTLPPTSHTYTL